MTRLRRALAPLAVGCALASTFAAPGRSATGEPDQPGSYCPFPAKGEKPVCFSEVEHRFGGFLQAVDAGKVDSAELVEVEDQLKRGSSEAERTLALSSLAYGYFILAERAAASPHPDPALVRRLASWNELLGAVYADARAEPGFRTAIRDAARDLQARAPAVSATCEHEADGEPCPTPGSLVETLRALDDPEAETGLRGALGRLLGRLIDEPPRDESPKSQ